MSCIEARERLAHYRDGWLGPDEQGRIEGHLAECSACKRAARRAGVAPRSQLPAAVRNAPAGRTAPGRVQGSRRRIHAAWSWLAAGLPLAAAVVLAFSLHSAPRQRPQLVPPAQPMLEGLTLPPYTLRWTEAHTSMELSDGTGDPNRSVMLLYSAPLVGPNR